MHKLEPFSISLEGRHLIEASAGTGKTYNITSLFVRCLIERKLEVDQILVLTYTKAATAELKDRILSRLRQSLTTLKKGEAPDKDEFLNQLSGQIENRDNAISLLERALQDFDEASIFTIHSFCQRALQEQSFLSGILFDSELVNDDSDLVQEAVDDWWRRLVRDAEESAINRAWLNILKEEDYDPKSLAGMVTKGIGKPYLDLQYREPPGDDRQQDLHHLIQLFDDLRENWEGEQTLIQQLLLSDAMNGNRYPSTSVPQWIEDLDHWLNEGVPSLNTIDKFDRFSIRFIRDNGTRKGKEAPDHPFFDLVPEYIDQVERVRSWIPAFKKELLEHVRQEVRDRKLSTGILSYDDLLVFLYEALERDRTGSALAKLLCDKFPVALVDEFQDTDPIQYKILSLIYDGRSADQGLFLIGDPKQSIYSFRGADLFSYLNARRTISEEQCYGLERNFRTHAKLIEAVNALFSSPDKPFLVDDIPFSPVRAAEITDIKPLLENGQQNPLLKFLHYDRPPADQYAAKGDARPDAAALTAEAIARQLNGGNQNDITIGEKPLRARDIAVLVRTHKQAEMVRRELERRSLKSVQYSEKSVFDTEEAKHLELLLQAIAEPRNERLIRTVLSTELFQYDAGDLLEFEEDEQVWTGILAWFSEWNRIWQNQGFTPMFWDFLQRAGVEEHLVKLEQGERKLTNLLQLGELLQGRQQETQGGMFELLQWISRKRSEPDKRGEEEQMRLERDEELVRIVTMHRSKGLEYPVVYCPFLWDGAYFSENGDPFLFHDEEHDHRSSLDLNEKGDPDREQHRYWAGQEELSEGLRLAYVAVTRAQQQCNIVFEAASDIEFSPLGYLLLGREQVQEQLRAKIFSGVEAPAIKPEAYQQQLDGFISENSDIITLNKIEENSVTKCHTDDNEGYSVQKSRPISRADIHSRSIVSSFSSIMHQESVTESEQSGEIFFPDELHADSSAGDQTIFTFPRGPQAGTCIHNIFEDIDFTSLDNLASVIKRNLNQFGFEESWTSVLESMVTSVLDQNLSVDLRLSEIPPESLIKEMEFYFNLTGFQRKQMLSTIRQDKDIASDDQQGIPEGFMKGYIDLVFREGAQFYIADYKSNFLGESPDDYRPERLREEMTAAGYDVQYHLYTVAVHRYLKTRLTDYSYDEHFGGVYYLFVRGMEDEGGIFADKPDRDVIEALDELFGNQGGQL